MPGTTERIGWTRASLARAAAAGAAAVAGGVAIGGRNGASLAAPSSDTDVDILNLFLLLEYVQESFYREAADSGRLQGDLLTFASTVGAQEREHVALLTERLGGRARKQPKTEFGESLSTPERFRDTAIELEEAALGAYIGQAANLTRTALAEVATLVSVEARQAAWVRDIAGVNPAPRAADPAGKPDAIVADLRKRGFLV
jgi:hypothetical protein